MNAQFEQAQQLANLWLETATKMMSAVVTVDEEQPPPDAARQLRDVSLAAMGQQADQYMRSPQFLAFVKQSLDAQIAFRKQLNQFFTEAHHSVQGVAKQDIDALSLSLRHMETRVLDRIEAVCERLEQVCRRLDAVEAPQAGAATPEKNNGHSQSEQATADATAELGTE